MKPMNIVLIVLGLVMFFAVTIAGFCGLSYVHYANYGNATEQALDAKYEDSQNVLATYTTKIAEIAQVPQMYQNGLKSVINATFNGRYGPDGSKAVVQFIKEQNMTLDPSMYKQIQDQMIAGRDSFQTSQTLVIDSVRSYKTSLNNVWGGFWLRIAGYPKINLDKYKPVINAHTAEAFETKRDEGIKLTQ